MPEEIQTPIHFLEDGTPMEPCCKHIGREVRSDKPKVSIIIPCYNVAGYVKETLESVFMQDYQDYELILINDGSDDTNILEKEILPYKEKLIYLKQVNYGVGPARNVAIHHSRGEILAFLDGDDVWLPGFLESQIKFLGENDYDMVYSDALIFGDPLMSGRTFMQDAPSHGEVTFESLLDLKCNVAFSSTLARKEAVLEAGMFEWKKVRSQDFNLWLRMARAEAKIGYQKKVLIKYRMRISSLSGDIVMRIDREIDAFNRVSETMELNNTQQSIITRHMRRLEADKEIQIGKVHLLNGDYTTAINCLMTGNKHHKSIKIKAAILALRVAPGLFSKFYRWHRQAEVSFLSGERNEQ